jgi:hypothetical protein
MGALVETANEGGAAAHELIEQTAQGTSSASLLMSCQSQCSVLRTRHATLPANTTVLSPRAEQKKTLSADDRH